MKINIELSNDCDFAMIEIDGKNFFLPCKHGDFTIRRSKDDGKDATLITETIGFQVLLEIRKAIIAGAITISEMRNFLNPETDTWTVSIYDEKAQFFKTLETLNQTGAFNNEN